MTARKRSAAEARALQKLGRAVEALKERLPTSAARDLGEALSAYASAQEARPAQQHALQKASRKAIARLEQQELALLRQQHLWLWDMIASLLTQRTKRQQIQGNTTQKLLAERRTFVQIVDDRQTKTGCSHHDAIVYAVKITRKAGLRKKSFLPWSALPEKEQKNEIRAAKARYKREKPGR